MLGRMLSYRLHIASWQTVLGLFFLFAWWPAYAAQVLDERPRIAIVSAFEPELALLMNHLVQPAHYTANGVQFTTGQLQGKPVVLLLSGMSMTNAAMTSQLALDRFNVTHMVLSGIAGGVNPALSIGDVTVAQRWGHYLEVLMARELEPGVFSADDPEGLPHVGPSFGMMATRPVRVRMAGRQEPEVRFWFDVDPKMLSAVQSLKDVKLEACDEGDRCLQQRPSLVIGGNGVSGSAFVDNAAFRQHLFDAFKANVVDMESAACAMVAHSNGVPFIAFRSLSDLAGGGEGVNEMHTFLNIAADNSAKVLLAFLEAWKQ